MRQEYFSEIRATNYPAKCNAIVETCATKQGTILVVDDTELVLRMVAMILGAANYLVLKALNGAEAVKLSTNYEGKIDLLLSDIKMEGMSGPDLGQCLMTNRPQMRVMFMSGFGRQELLAVDYCWTYIDKPFQPRKLLETIDVLLGSSEAVLTLA